MRLRPARPADAPAIAAIWHPGWRDGHLGHVPDDLLAARTPPSFLSRSAELVPQTTVATVDGSVAGFVVVTGDEVEQVYVDADHRGSGIADALLTEAENRVAAAGHAAAWLKVVPGNARARRFYERRGWTDDGDLVFELAFEGRVIPVPCRRYVKPLPRSNRGA